MGPYRWNHGDLQEHVETILRAHFGQGSTSSSRLRRRSFGALGLAEPNPFTAETTIRFTIPRRNRVSLTIWDVSERRVRVLYDDMQDAGVKDIVWNGRGATGWPAAARFHSYRLQAEDRTAEWKMLRLRRMRQRFS